MAGLAFLLNLSSHEFGGLLEQARLKLDDYLYEYVCVVLNNVFEQIFLMT